MDQSNLNPSDWVDKYGDYLYNYTISRMQSPEIAEDLVQDTFLSALKATKSFKGKSSERTWLTAILKRKIIDHYRENSKKIEDKILDDNKPFKKSGFFEGHWLKEKAPISWDSEENIENKELIQILKYCLSILPVKWAACFNLKNMEEISNEEICKELGISVSNLWVMLHRARLQLRECLETNWFK